MRETKLSIDNDTGTAGAQKRRSAATGLAGENVADRSVLSREHDVGLATAILSVADSPGTGSSGRGFPTRCTPAFASLSASLFQKVSASESVVWALIQSIEVGYRAAVVRRAR